MATTAFSPSSPRLPHTGILPGNPRKTGPTIRRVFITAQKGKSDGKSVDENMIVLRMRIKKMKVLESSKSSSRWAAPPSSDWKEWEKKIFTHYHEGVCESIEMLQAYLMNTRPSVALGMVALIAMSVPFSSSLVMANTIKVVKGLLAGCHVCIDIDF